MKKGMRILESKSHSVETSGGLRYQAVLSTRDEVTEP